MTTDEIVQSPTSRRHRHRSPRQKLLQSVLLIVGVPALLLTVLALSVELIEYRASDSYPAIEPPAHRDPPAAPLRSHPPLRVGMEPQGLDPTLELDTR